MTVRNFRTVIYFTQRYEKLRSYDVIIKVKSHVKRKILIICLFSVLLFQYFTVLHDNAPVSHFRQIFIVRHNNESMTELIPQLKK